MNNENIRIVLVGTTHPGNIGGAARAMKNMGLKKLVLVEPKIFPSPDATNRAAGADDILNSAELYSSLQEAVRDCCWVVGTSARLRKVAWPILSPRDCATQVQAESKRGPVAIVFGREHSGLSNEELDVCHALLNIPTDPEFSSLNLAAAVQVVSYELRLASDIVTEIEQETDSPMATAEQMDGYFQRLDSVLSEIGFLKPPNCQQLSRRLQRIYSRARLDQRELNILHGILSATLGHKYRWMEKSGLPEHGPTEGES